MKLQRRVISGARVQFDPRTSAEVDSSRSTRNLMTEQQPMRKRIREERLRREQAQRQSKQ